MAKVSMINRDAKKKRAIQHRNRCKLCGRPRGYMGFCVKLMEILVTAQMTLM